MNHETPRSALIACVAVFAAACGGLSDVGKQDNDSSPPIADAVILNHPFTKDASGNVTARVRAGSEVFLSGKDSDGTVAPVLRFDWSLVTQSAVASQVNLISRNENTRSFAAPDVTQDTDLQFRLVVTDANGQTAQKDVNITVVAIPDADHFFSYNLDDLRKLKIVAVTSSDVASGQMQGGDVGFEITVRRFVDYTTAGVDGPYLELDSQVLTGKWLAVYGSRSACDAVQNPAFQVGVPALDVDDILAKIDVHNPELEPNAALIDSFNVKVRISIRLLAAADASGSLPSGVTADVCAERVAAPAAAATAGQKISLDGKRTFAKTSAAADTIELNLADLIGPPDSTVDTLQSARAYYAAVDSAGERKTFINWLRVNGFLSPDATSFSWRDLEASAGAHGTYTNNFDLGFGRDMYARIVSCERATPQLGQAIPRSAIGSCDVAAVVVNYASLEAASKKLNPVLIVAMEYSQPRAAEHRFVQFYTYAPDTVTGQFEQVMSANLDGRGEKYMPQVCTVCHGGTPGGLTAGGAYQNGGDLHATFLPWDLDSFLFSDTEGRNADRSYAEQSLRQFYTRSAQSEPLRKLNQLAYLTYHDATRANRFVLPAQLIEGWYGADATSAFTSTTFKGDYVPAGWSANGIDGIAGTADDNPADAPTIYKDVFGRSCRMCHVAHMPSTGASGDHLETLATASDTFNTCDNELTKNGSGQIIEPSSIGAARQDPFACYGQFFNAPSLPQRLSGGLMPFARLTMDRFWVGDGSASQPGGRVLFDHLAARYTADNDTGRLAALQTPGTPEAVVQLTAASPADIGSMVSLDGTRSRFARDFAWSLERCNTEPAVAPVCRPTVPATPAANALVCATASEPIVGEHAAFAGFQVQQTGFYRANLAVNSLASAASSSLTVPDWEPCLKNPGVVTRSATVGNGQLMDAETLFSLGNGELANHTLVASASGLVTIAPACLGTEGCPADTEMTFTPGGVGTNDITVTLHDQDGENVTATVRLTGTSSLSAAPLTRSINANASTSVDLLALNGNLPNVTFEILSQNCPNGGVDDACLRNDAGVRATLTPTATGFTYAPPGNFSTHDVAGGAHFGGNRFLEQIQYRLVRTDNPNDFSQPAVVDIPVRALTTFAAAAATWTTTSLDCRSCHVTGSGGAPTYLASGDYAQLRNGNLVNLPGRAKVNLTNVDDSGLLCYPLEACVGAHGGDARTAAEMANVRNWIRSGANNY